MKRKCLVLLLLLFAINNIFSVSWKANTKPQPMITANIDAQVISNQATKNISSSIKIQHDAFPIANTKDMWISFYDHGEIIDFGSSDMLVAVDIIGKAQRKSEVHIYNDTMSFNDLDTAFILSTLSFAFNVTLRFYINGDIYQIIIPYSEDLLYLLETYLTSDEYKNLGTWNVSKSKYSSRVTVEYANYPDNCKNSIILMRWTTNPSENYESTGLSFILFDLMPNEFGYYAGLVKYIAIRNSQRGYEIKDRAWYSLNENVIKALIELAKEEDTLEFVVKFDEKYDNYYKLTINSEDFIKYLSHPIRFMY